MNAIAVSFWAEALKVKKSKTVWLTAFVFAFVPLMIGFLFLIMLNPDIAQNMGLVSLKAQAIGNADWQMMLMMLKQVISVGGLLGFGFVTCWVFGREYIDRTAKDLLALPVSREAIIVSKFLMVFFWCIALSFLVFLSGIAVGCAVGLSGWEWSLVGKEFFSFELTAVLSMVLCTPVAFFAMVSRGYLLPLGFVLITILLIQFLRVLGLAPYFPWAVPALYSGAFGEVQLSSMSYIILLITGCIGAAGTFFWWSRADQN